MFYVNIELLQFTAVCITIYRISFITFYVRVYYILPHQLLLHFAAFLLQFTAVLHFTAILLQFTAVITIYRVYYNLRRNNIPKS